LSCFCTAGSKCPDTAFLPRRAGQHTPDPESFLLPEPGFVRQPSGRLPPAGDSLPMLFFVSPCRHAFVSIRITVYNNTCLQDITQACELATVWKRVICGGLLTYFFVPLCIHADIWVRAHRSRSACLQVDALADPCKECRDFLRRLSPWLRFLCRQSLFERIHKGVSLHPVHGRGVQPVLRHGLSRLQI
jgi:hypothetical protein